MNHTRVLALISVVAFIPPHSTLHLDRIRDDQWHLRFLDVSQAHTHAQGDGLVVAVIDTGVDPHPDLRNNLLSGIDLVANVEEGRHDEDSHGTGMAGLIASHGRGDDDGALGVAPKAKILPIRDRFSPALEGGDLLATGIEWALGRNADVISISLGGSPSARLRKAVEAAVREDVVIVASVGNKTTTRGVTFPAAYDGVLAVGAIDRRGVLADISVTGKQVAISAPGVDIFSTSHKGLYRKGTGTSDAAAIVSGAVALVRSKYPDLSAGDVVHRLTATATDKGPPGRDEQYGYGVVNLVAALTADIPSLESSTTGPPTADASPPKVPERGNAATFVIAALSLLTAVAVAGVAVAYRRRRR